jgi:ATP-binding cassette subfamily C protein LapB
MLLDEPTASMDGALESQCLQIFKESGSLNKTMVLVTHKESLLSLVDRLIVVVNGSILMDGPREEVLKLLRTDRKVVHVI